MLLVRSFELKPELHKEYSFLEPLNPILPAEDQEITCPDALVREMMMLLKEALMCA